MFSKARPEKLPDHHCTGLQRAAAKKMQLHLALSSSTVFLSVLNCISLTHKLYFSQSQTVFLSVTNCISLTHKLHFSQSQTVFLSLTNCICLTHKLYFSQTQTAFLSLTNYDLWSMIYKSNETYCTFPVPAPSLWESLQCLVWSKQGDSTCTSAAHPTTLMSNLVTQQYGKLYFCWRLHSF